MYVRWTSYKICSANYRSSVGVYTNKLYQFHKAWESTLDHYCIYLLNQQLDSRKRPQKEDSEAKCASLNEMWWRCTPSKPTVTQSLQSNCHIAWRASLPLLYKGDTQGTYRKTHMHPFAERETSFIFWGLFHQFNPQFIRVGRYEVCKEPSFFNFILSMNFNPSARCWVLGAGWRTSDVHLEAITGAYRTARTST